MSCLALCHGGIADKLVSFGSVSFPHAVHMEGEDGCARCHSPYAQHGQTRLAGCSDCHHGTGMGRVRCSDCHRAEEAMFQGKGVKEGVVIQNQIAGFQIGQERGQGGRAAVLSQDGEDESDVFRGELHPAVRLDHFHKKMRSIISSTWLCDFAVSR
jgi:hypothetical protein